MGQLIFRLQLLDQGYINSLASQTDLQTKSWLVLRYVELRLILLVSQVSDFIETCIRHLRVVKVELDAVNWQMILPAFDFLHADRR